MKMFLLAGLLAAASSAKAAPTRYVDESCAAFDAATCGMAPVYEISATHSYIFFVSGKPWHVAKAHCDSIGTHLASVESADENTFLTNVKNSLGQVAMWLGGTDEVEEGQWLWEDGTPISYSNWAANEPNDSGTAEHALVLQWSGSWNDLPSDYRIGYICERE